MTPSITKSAFLVVLEVLATFARANIPGHDPTRIQVLLLTGYNSTPMHHWRINDPVLREMLEATGKSKVRIDEEPRGITQETFSGYDVLLLDYSDYTRSLGPTWPETSRQAYLDFLKSGGGVVAFHVTIGSFPEWPEFAETMGIKEREHLGHAPCHTFTVEVADSLNPITQDLPLQFEEWGEVYNGFSVAPDAHTLATAFDDPKNCSPECRNCGSGKTESIL